MTKQLNYFQLFLYYSFTKKEKNKGKESKKRKGTKEKREKEKRVRLKYIFLNYLTYRLKDIANRKIRFVPYHTIIFANISPKY